MQDVQRSSFVVPEVSDMFIRYTGHTDGKELLAQEIKSLSPAGGILLDLGAGDGQLTSRIAPHFSKTIAVERNSKYQAKLKAIPNTSVVIGTMEESLPDTQFDVALLSYSLTGVPPEQSKKFFDGLLERRAPGGRVYVVTFQDLCDWDIFVTPIYAEIGKPRNGGTRAHLDIIESAGYSADRVSAVRTEIFDDNLPKLAETLGFFFAPSHADYFAKISFHHRALNSFIQPSRYGGVALSCIEEIWEVKA